MFGAFAWVLRVRPQVLLTWSQDEPGLIMTLTRRFRSQSQGGRRRKREREKAV